MNYETEKRVFLSCCGSYCHTCDWFSGRIRAQGEGTRRMLAEFSNFPKLFGENEKKIAKAMARLAETSICSGCQQEGGVGDRCSIRACCHSKGLTHCSECPAFPCKMLSENPGVIKFKTLENFAEIKRIGWEAWVDRQWKEHVERSAR
jgi:hypothetical protein